MINLLPTSEKKKLLKEYRIRLAVTILWGILLLQVLAFAALVPSYQRISSSTNILESQLAEKKSTQLPGGDEVQNKINTIKKEIALLKPTVTSVDIPPTEVIALILNMKPSGIVVSSVAYGRAGTSALIQLSGIADSREDLFTFQRLLSQDPRMSDIRYAQSFITKKAPIDFQLSVTIK
jgi:Tfp pilus assembly protein PilN